MKLFGLIGYPLSHSFSAGYFNKKFQNLALTDHEYRNFEIENIGQVKDILKLDHLAGINITIPYKTDILDYTNYLSPEVKAIGAANTLRILNGRIEAFNTDYLGFKNSLEGLPFDRKLKALILGTGGSSKAVAYALEEEKIEYDTVSRHPNNTQINYQSLVKSGLEPYSLIVNTTPLGMHPKIDDSPTIPYDEITSNHFCYDIVYNPEKTKFLEKAEKGNAGIKNGLEMLILQAEASWTIWSEVK